MKLSWKAVVFALAFGMSAARVASAQAPVPVIGSERVYWDQSAATLAEAQSYTYAFQIDGGSGVAALNVVCGGPGPGYVCSAAFPASTPGNHSMTLTASITVNGTTVTSAPSASISYRLVVAPAPPTNPRFVP